MRKVALGILTIAALWSFWSIYGRSPAWQSSELALDLMQPVTADTACARNIVGMQPYMYATDYLGKKHFYEKLHGYFEDAKKNGYFKKNTLVQLPEYLGTWLVIAGEKSSVAQASTINGAMTLMVLSNPIKFAGSFFMHQSESDRFAAGIFRMKAVQMADLYEETFKKLAMEYRVTIDAGSIVLPGPGIKDDHIVVDLSSPLYNTSFIFKPAGTMEPQAIKKSFPIHSEQPFLQAAPVADLPVFDLPIGKTAVLVCADSWYPAAYRQISRSGAAVILVNSYCAGQRTMSQQWKGYDGGETPADVDTADVGRLTEREAWVKYALPGRIGETQAIIGANVFLRGELWDLGTDGQPFFVANGHLLHTAKSNRAGIWNFCF